MVVIYIKRCVYLLGMICIVGIGSVGEVDDDAGHVISSYTVLCVWSYNFLKELTNVVAYFCVTSVFCFLFIIVDFFAALIVVDTVPNSIAGQNNVFVSTFPFSYCHVWVGSHSLVFPVEFL